MIQNKLTEMPGHRPSTDRALKKGRSVSSSVGEWGSESIFIPAAERGRPVKSLVLSVRLGNVLEAKGIHLTGELHGKTYAEIAKYRNCGRKTVVELRELVRQMQSGSDEGTSHDQQPAPVNTSLLFVPATGRNLKLTDLPLSVRLEKVLQRCNYLSLGDLNGVDVQELLNQKNCGRKCILELCEFIHRASAGEFLTTKSGDIGASLRAIACAIDAGLARLSPRDRKIFEARLLGDNGNPRTLEDVGLEFRMTRERVRQIVKSVMHQVRRGGGPKLAQAVAAVARECEQRVCPLTFELFVRWIGEQAPALSHTPQFYVRALDTMEQAIPAWPPGSTREGGGDPNSERVEKAIAKWVRQTGARPTAAEAYAHLRRHNASPDLQVGQFLAALRKARKIIVDFLEPDRPELRLRRLRILDFARAVLAESSEPLAPEEIVERAKARYGEEAIMVSARGAANSLTPEQGFFLLGPRSLGLRKHFHTPKSRWPALCNEFENLLRRENRPVSTIEAVDQVRGGRFEVSNSYEMARIVREDPRFVDLGRRLFGLAEWGVQEREFVKDLLPRVFSEAKRVLTVQQTLERLTRLRSVSPYSIANILQKHPEVRSFGFGYYGLKNWGVLEKEVIR